jgi:hypothetical protein
MINEKTGNVNRKDSTLEISQTWRGTPLSDVCEIKAKIWLAGREASPFAGQGRHFRIVDGEVFGKRHYAERKRAF